MTVLPTPPSNKSSLVAPLQQEQPRSAAASNTPAETVPSIAASTIIQPPTSAPTSYTDGTPSALQVAQSSMAPILPPPRACSSSSVEVRKRAQIEAQDAELAVKLAGLTSGMRPRRSATERQVSYAPNCDANGEPILTKEQKERKKQREREKKEKEKQKQKQEASRQASREKSVDVASSSRRAKRVIRIDSDDELRSSTSRPASEVLQPKRPKTFNLLSSSPEPRPSNGAAAAATLHAPVPPPDDARAVPVRNTTLPIVDLSTSTGGATSPVAESSLCVASPAPGPEASINAEGRGMRKRKSIDKDSWLSPAKQAAADAAAIVAARTAASESPVVQRRKRFMVVESDAEHEEREEEEEELTTTKKKKSKTPSPKKRTAATPVKSVSASKRKAGSKILDSEEEEQSEPEQEEGEGKATSQAEKAPTPARVEEDHIPTPSVAARAAPTAQPQSISAKLAPAPASVSLATATTSTSASGSKNASVRISRGPAPTKASSASSASGNHNNKANPRRSFEGKPLSALVTGVRRPGLAKRASIPTLHPNRNPNPTTRAPLAVARSKAEEKADAEMDSDEERQRQNETPQQRMRRKIREAEEEWCEPPAGWEKVDSDKMGGASQQGGWEHGRFQGAGDGGEGMEAEYAEYD